MDIEDDSDDEDYDGSMMALTPQYCIAQAASEGLTLVRFSFVGFGGTIATGFVGVSNPNPDGRPKQYKAELTLDGKRVSLGYYATAEEAALAYARALGPEGSQAANAPYELRRREELRRRMRKLRRHAIIVGKAASLLQTMYTEVTYRPGNQGQKRSREEFEAAAAAQCA